MCFFWFLYNPPRKYAERFLYNPPWKCSTLFCKERYNGFLMYLTLYYIFFASPSQKEIIQEVMNFWMLCIRIKGPKYRVGRTMHTWSWNWPNLDNLSNKIWRYNLVYLLSNKKHLFFRDKLDKFSKSKVKNDLFMKYNKNIQNKVF